MPQGPTLHIFRELAAIRRHLTQAGDPWDTRWHLTGPAIQGLKVRALGWQGDLPPEAQGRTGLPPGALAALPALWDGETLAAFRPLGIGPDYDTRLLSPLAPRTGTLQELLRDA